MPYMDFIKKLFTKRTTVPSELVDSGAPKKLLSSELQMNIDIVKEQFHYPLSQGLKIRNFYIASLQRNSALVYLEGASDTKVIQSQVIEPLLHTSAPAVPPDDIPSYLICHVVTASYAETVQTFQSVVRDLLNGSSMIFVEGIPLAISVDTTKFEKRSIKEPTVENSLIGPKEAFIESLEVNLSLIRKQIRDQNLICEKMNVGERAQNQVCVMYVNQVADPILIGKVKERISQIYWDHIANTTILQQHLEERPYSLIPSMRLTERPDVAVSYLMQGHIVVLMDNSPNVIIAPVTFWMFFHTAEDQYLSWAGGNFVRFVRLIAIFVALLTPSIFIAVSNFHVEMLPTDLMLAIAGAREKVPFPSFLEILFMEISFEILREAGVRTPVIIGPTIGIVGALLLGQAAVDANIVSPIMVIVVAITGLSSFAVPEVTFNYSVRILRFVILLVAALFGFFGIALLLIYLTAYLSSIKSFDVPFLSPMAPHQRSSKNLIFRPPAWKQWLRPQFTSPQNPTRGKKPEGG
jgi:spore germination protein KA